MLLRLLETKLTGEKRANWEGHLLPQGIINNITNERDCPTERREAECKGLANLQR